MIRAPRARTLRCPLTSFTSPLGTNGFPGMLKRAGICAPGRRPDHDTPPRRSLYRGVRGPRNPGNPGGPGVSYLEEMDRPASIGHRPDLRQSCVQFQRGVEYAAVVAVRGKGESR